jgi:hypothetical protein
MMEIHFTVTLRYNEATGLHDAEMYAFESGSKTADHSSSSRGWKSPKRAAHEASLLLENYLLERTEAAS